MNEDGTQSAPTQTGAKLGTPRDAGQKLKGRPLVAPLTLPSQGYPYEGQLPDGKILISSMTVEEEKLFTNKSGLATDRLDILFQRCCDLGELHPRDLVIGDRFFLMLKLRSVSYGNRYGFQFRCQDCDSQFRHEIDLERDLPLRTLVEEWSEPFDVALPITGKEIGLRLLRGKHQAHIEKSTKRKEHKKLGDPGDRSYSMILGLHIVAINGVEAREVEAIKFVESLPVKDREAITEAVEANSPGYSREIEIECPECGFYNEAVLPVSTEFFRSKHST